MNFHVEDLLQSTVSEYYKRLQLRSVSSGLFYLSPVETRGFNCSLVEKSLKSCLFQVCIFKIVAVLKKFSKPRSCKWITSEKCPLHTLNI